jgi:predicted outer membrane repeat protein
MKNKIKYINITIFAVFTTLLLFCSLASISASNQTIDNSTSGGIAQGITDTGSGDTLFLQPGIYNKTTDRGISINKSITIQGNGSTDTIIIDAKNLTRIFYINNNSITFINITFINGNTSNDGGAISNDNFAYITFLNCRFINNTAAGYGGAINNNGHNFTVINCTFTNSTSTGSSNSGGAIRNQGNNFTVINSTFINNEANAGGAILDMSNNFTLINSTFANNTARTYGGAITHMSYNFTVINCTFTNNTATWGGVIFGQNSNGFTIINSTFTNNNATTGSGGVIYSEDNNYLIINSTFTNNEAYRGYGGAIHNHGGNFTIINSTFTNNTAYNSGAAIYNSNRGYNFTVTNTSFTNNTAQWGGAIYNQGNSSTITNSNFTDNKAELNGGAINNNGNLIITDSNFTNNKAGTGGAIYNNINSNMSVSHNIMASNSADLGHMIYNGGNIGILNLTFIDNSTMKTTKGSNVTIYASLTDDMGNTITGQNITFYVNGSFFGSIESIEGYANITYTVNGAAGAILPVTGSYNGIGNYQIIINNGQLLIQIFTNSTINAPDGKVGNSINISGIATDVDGNPIANTQITVTINGATYNVTTNSNGEWNFIFTPNLAGNFTTTVSWIGNSTHNGFTNSTTFNIAKLSTSISVVAPDGEVGQTINIHGVLIDENGELIANALITVTVDGKKYTVTTDENGRWTLPYKTVKAGNIEVLVSFEGDSIYLASENVTTFNVKATNPTNPTNETNETNNTTDNPIAKAAVMKETGMPINIFLIVLLSLLGFGYYRKQ